MSFSFSKAVQSELVSKQAPWGGFPEYNFVGGHVDADVVPVEKLAKAVEAVLTREGKTLATYSLNSGPQGYLPLREYLVKKLNTYTQIDCNADEILLTSGSLQAIDLINASLLKPGDTVIVEESNYGGVLTRLDQLNVNMVSVPVDVSGMMTNQLASVLGDLASRNVKPRYIYTMPTVHNPTGSILPIERRHELIRLASEFDVPIFEDECYADLVWSGERPPALYALDRSNRVVHVGSFSKTIAPALRVGYIVADWSLISPLLSLKNDAGSGALEQMLLAEYCSTEFDTHLVSLNASLKSKLDTLVTSIDKEFGTTAEYDVPPGGMFLWIKLPEVVDTSKLAAVAAVEGIALNPGNEWSLQSDANSRLRLCFANPSHDQIIDGVKKLAEICHREFGVPIYGGNQIRS